MRCLMPYFYFFKTLKASTTHARYHRQNNQSRKYPEKDKRKKLRGYITFHLPQNFVPQR